jgi:hypothetical protein
MRGVGPVSTGVWSAPRLPDDWPLWAGIVALEVVALAVYITATGAVESARYALYPFVWINVGLFAVTRVGPVRTGRRRRLTAAGVAAAYGLVLAVLTGLVGIPIGEHTHAHPSGLTASLSAPGWGPRIAYVLGEFHLYFVPFRVVGYVALSYLVYARLATLSLASGVGAVGFAACIGCTLPLLAGTLGGAGAAALAAVGGYSLDLSTLAFLLAVGGLWQPWRG